MSYRRTPSPSAGLRKRTAVSPVVIDVDGIEVTVTRKRIRNLYLRVKPPLGAVEVSAPTRMAQRRIEGFVRERRDWIDGQRERLAQARRRMVEEMAMRDGGADASAPGASAPGASGSGVPQAVAVPLDGLDDLGPMPPAPPAVPPPSDGSCGPDRPDAAARAFAWTDERKSRAAAAIEAALPGLLAKWEPVVGRSPSHITLRLMTSRWGSCTPKTRRIRLNLQLGLMEPKFLEYVLVHEMTHLWEHGHGPGFRARMDAYLPGWRKLRRELNRRVVL